MLMRDVVLEESVKTRPNFRLATSYFLLPPSYSHHHLATATISGTIISITTSGRVNAINVSHRHEQPSSKNKLLIEIGSILQAITRSLSGAAFRDEEFQTSSKLSIADSHGIIG